MPRSSSADLKAISRFRLRRHHLLDEPGVDEVTICRDVCGVQAQVMSSAYLQLWARNHALTRGEIETSLWRTRTLVKTSLLRQTLHVIPADEFSLYIAALKPSRMAALLRLMSKFGIDREEAQALTALIMDALSAGPLGRPAITAAILPKVSKRVAFLDGKCMERCSRAGGRGIDLLRAGRKQRSKFHPRRPLAP